jgi:hypothetical protein
VQKKIARERRKSPVFGIGYEGVMFGASNIEPVLPVLCNSLLLAQHLA